MSFEIMKILPAGLREKFQGVDMIKEGFTELRFRCNGPVMLLRGREECFLHKHGGICAEKEQGYIISVNEIREMMEYISNFSVYAFEEELRQGFLTIPGGHRVGICGKTVLAEGNIKTIRNISFLNIRLARQVQGCGEELLPYLFLGDRLYHTLVVSPPGCGKTTLLRDIIRLVSDGSTWQDRQGVSKIIRGRKVGVVDERSELAACYNGVPQNYLGRRTDVLDGCPKEKGLELMLRSMSPEVIAVDELGGEREMEWIAKSIYCGCSILATVHGEGRESWLFRKEEEKRKKLLTGMFERYIFLKPGKPGCVETVCDCEGREVSAEW